MSEENNEIDLSHILAPENQRDTVLMARGLLPFAEQASDACVLLCVALVEARGDFKLVEKWTGYDRKTTSVHVQSKLAQRILKALAKIKLTTEGYMLGIFTLMELAESRSQTGTARKNAAQALIELSDEESEKHTDKGGDTKDLNNMTLSELESYANSIKADLIRIGPKNVAQDVDLIDL